MLKKLKMPSSYTSSQKNAIAQFVGFTQVKDSVAAKQLKNHSWNVERAVDAYFADGNAPVPNAATTSSTASTSSLNKLFEKYRTPSDEPDSLGIEGSIKYFEDLGLGLDDPVCFTILLELGAPTVGEFTKAGFVEGWTRLRADTIPKQQAQIDSLRKSLATNADVFKRTYKATFALSKPANAKVIALENAIELWKSLLSPPSINWSSDTTPWLDWWVEYLEAKWKKAVSKDLWDQTGLFVQKSREDESMSWWNEEGSWPGAIDEFVAIVKERREGGNAMDVGQ